MPTDPTAFAPRYLVVEKIGPDHDRTFVVEVMIHNRGYGKGEGKNKKEAEQQAAGVAYNALTTRESGRGSRRDSVHRRPH